jgi:hypothetical protein
VVEINGTTERPLIRVRGGRLENAIVAGVRIDRGAFEGTFANGVLDASAVITRASGKPVASTLDVRARVDRAGNLRGTFTAPRLDLAVLEPLFPEAARVSGDIRLAGTLGGALRRPS